MQRAASCMTLLALGIGGLVLLAILITILNTPMSYDARMTAVGAVIVFTIIGIGILGGV